MRFVALHFLAVSALTLLACGDAATGADDAIGGGESNYTSEGGAPDAARPDAGESADVAPFTVADVEAQPKLRFSVDGAPAIDAYEPSWTTVLSGTDRRFQLQGASPVPGGKPAFYVEFGRGAAFIERGTYDCARTEAIALIVEADGTKKLTVVDGAAPRACKVVIDDAVDVEPATGVRPRSWRKVVGHVEATVGDRTNAASDTKSVRAAFAVNVIER